MSYQDLSARAESPSDAARARVNINVIALLATIANLVRSAGVESDTLKKAIFYGKGDIPEADPRHLAHNTHFKLAAECLAKDDKAIRLLHAALGLVSEAAEFFTAVTDHVLDGLDLDTVNLKEELGDNQWYVALANRALETTFEQIQYTNIWKLRERYPDGFTEDKAVNRDLGAERAVLGVIAEPRKETLTLPEVKFKA